METADGQLPDAAIVFVIVYVPIVLAVKSTTPVEELITSPAVELNTPAEPVITGEGFAPPWQYGLPTKLKVASNADAIVIGDVEVTAGQPPAAAIVLVTVYVPSVLDNKSTKPVDELITKPAVEVKVPATPPPLKVGNGLVLLWQ